MVYSLGAAMKVNGRAVIGYDMIPGDGDRKKIEVVDPTPDGGLYMTDGRALMSGRPVRGDHMPQQLKRRSAGVIPDYSQFYGLKIVSPLLRTIIESFEPNIHQFFPMQIVGAKKAVLADMFFLVVCNRLDSIDREHTTLLLAHGIHWMPGREVPRDQWPPNFNPNVKGRVVFSRAKIGDHHLWYDKHHGGGPFLSNEMTNALLEAGVTGLNIVEVEEV